MTRAFAGLREASPFVSAADVLPLMGYPWTGVESRVLLHEWPAALTDLDAASPRHGAERFLVALRFPSVFLDAGGWSWLLELRRLELNGEALTPDEDHDLDRAEAPEALAALAAQLVARGEGGVLEWLTASPSVSVRCGHDHRLVLSDGWWLMRHHQDLDLTAEATAIALGGGSPGCVRLALWVNGATPAAPAPQSWHALRAAGCLAAWMAVGRTGREVSALSAAGRRPRRADGVQLELEILGRRTSASVVRG